MKLVRQAEYKIVNDDGTDLMPYEKQNITNLMRHFQSANVIGENSPLGDHSALRMAQVVYDNYYVTPKDESSNISQTRNDNLKEQMKGVSDIIGSSLIIR